MAGNSPPPRRRDEALAYILERIVRTGASPSFQEIADGLNPRVSKARAQQLVDELIIRGDVEKVPGTQRALRIRDVSLARQVLEQFAQTLGWKLAPSTEPFPEALPHVKLPRRPSIGDNPELR